MTTSIECVRNGRPYERFAGRGKGYDVLAYDRDEPTTKLRDRPVGHAVKAMDNWGRRMGWVILDYDTGETILGAGDSTKIGYGLGDCLYMYSCRLEERGLPL